MKIAVVTQHDDCWSTPFLYNFLCTFPFKVSVVIRMGQREFGMPPVKFPFIEKIISSAIIFGVFFVLKTIIRAIYNKILLYYAPHSILLGEQKLHSLLLSKNIEFIRLGNKNKDVDTLRYILAKGRFDVVVNNSGVIYDEDMRGSVDVGIVNVHNSLLPKNRGRFPLFWSFMEEDPEYGVTVHFIGKYIDAGPIFMQHKFNIPSDYSLPQIIRYFVKNVPLVLNKALGCLVRGEIAKMRRGGMGAPISFFPSIKDALRYQRILKRRRIQYNVSR